jgi:hypothetical protein
MCAPLHLNTLGRSFQATATAGEKRLGLVDRFGHHRAAEHLPHVEALDDVQRHLCPAIPLRSACDSHVGFSFGVNGLGLEQREAREYREYRRHDSRDASAKDASDAEGHSQGINRRELCRFDDLYDSADQAEPHADIDAKADASDHEQDSE